MTLSYNEAQGFPSPPNTKILIMSEETLKFRERFTLEKHSVFYIQATEESETHSSNMVELKNFPPPCIIPSDIGSNEML